MIVGGEWGSHPCGSRFRRSPLGGLIVRRSVVTHVPYVIVKSKSLVQDNRENRELSESGTDRFEATGKSKRWVAFNSLTILVSCRDRMRTEGVGTMYPGDDIGGLGIRQYNSQ